MAGGVAEVVFGGERVRVGDCALEKRFGFSESFEANQDVGVVVEESGVWGVLRGTGNQGGVERLSFVVLLVAAVEAAE